LDPYINVDAGTMSPYQHGEVFVTDDGGETDLDLGHYERFTSGRVTRDHNVTTGRSEEHTSELQSQSNLVCRLLLEKKKQTQQHHSEMPIHSTTLHAPHAHQRPRRVHIQIMKQQHVYAQDRAHALRHQSD